MLVAALRLTRGVQGIAQRNLLFGLYFPVVSIVAAPLLTVVDILPTIAYALRKASAGTFPVPVFSNAPRG